MPKNIKKWIINILLISINVIFYIILIKPGYRNYDGDYIVYDSSENIQKSILLFIVYIPVTCFIIGSIISFFKNKMVKMKVDSIKYFLIAIIFVNSIFVVGFLIILIRTLIGVYPPNI